MAKVIGVELYSQSLRSVVEQLVDICLNGRKENRCVSATGAHGLVEAQASKSYKTILNSFFWNLPDGMPAVWVMKLKGNKDAERCSGPDFFEDVMLRTAQENISHYFVGGKEGVALQLKENCGMNFLNNNIVGVYSPPFREMTETELKELGDDINAKNTDIVWIGLSTPKQEKFAVRILDFIHVPFIITVGAAFDFHTGAISRSPEFFQKIGLEWFYRMCRDPKRLIRRYSKVVPSFIFYNLKELTFWLLGQRRGNESEN